MGLKLTSAHVPFKRSGWEDQGYGYVTVCWASDRLLCLSQSRPTVLILCTLLVESPRWSVELRQSVENWLPEARAKEVQSVTKPAGGFMFVAVVLY